MSQLSVSQQIVQAVGPLVGGRCYARTFLQPDGALPPWPAARFVFASLTTAPSICGDGGDDAADYRVQIDLADAYGKGEAAFLALRAQLLAAMQALGATFVLDGQRDEFDAETKTLRCSLDYLVYQSN
ncbi:DUF3168 domain-containing protein [Diaphorobacter sp.]|uniref:tail completion protein gp17 n=1 Tax=Diaphorobacter sp. TaxID=1934310 RepID=UPI00259096D6|nr:DUF3168 domain-containing protein [Diaphorobacter sp.]